MADPQDGRPRKPADERPRRRLRRLLKYSLGAVGVLVAIVGSYLAAALLLGVLSVNGDFKNAGEGIEVYLVSNGVHVDFVLPVRSPVIDWSELFPRAQFARVDSGNAHVMFGWGERSFYIETPTWGDVNAWTVLKAMVWPTPAAMHVQYLRQPPGGDGARRVVLSESQYGRLVAAIRSSFRRSGEDGVQLIRGKGYGVTDNFYEGAGAYHALNTCNMWTNRVLKETGVKTAVWSPFTSGILYHLERD